VKDLYALYLQDFKILRCTQTALYLRSQDDRRNVRMTRLWVCHQLERATT